MAHNTKERLAYHVRWLANMASKQFPENGLTDDEIATTEELLLLISKFPDSMLENVEIKFKGEDEFRKYIHRLNGKE